MNLTKKYQVAKLLQSIHPSDLDLVVQNINEVYQEIKEEVTAKKNALEHAAKAHADLIENLRAQGLTDDEINAVFGKKKGRVFPLPDKYKYVSEDGRVFYWSGRGRRPQWVMQIEAEGKDLSDYLVEGAKSSDVAEAKADADVQIQGESVSNDEQDKPKADKPIAVDVDSNACADENAVSKQNQSDKLESELDSEEAPF